MRSIAHATPLELLALPPLETYTSKLGGDRKGMGLLMVLLMELGKRCSSEN